MLQQLGPQPAARQDSVRRHLARAGQHGSIPWRCRSTAGHTTEGARQPLEATRRYTCRGQTENGDTGSAQPTYHERGCALLLHNIRSVAHHMRWPGGRAGTRHRCHAAIVNNGCEHMGIGTQPRRTHLQRSIGRRQEAHQRLHTPQVQELKPSQTTAEPRGRGQPSRRATLFGNALASTRLPCRRSPLQSTG